MVIGTKVACYTILSLVYIDNRKVEWYKVRCKCGIEKTTSKPNIMKQRTGCKNCLKVRNQSVIGYLIRGYQMDLQREKHTKRWGR